MREQLDKNNYVLIDNFISPKKTKELEKEFSNYLYEYPELFQKDEQCPSSLAIYNYRTFLELLVEKTNFMSDLMGEPMLPTYVYSRIYKKGEVLAPHTDRGSCEVSVTLHLGSDGTKWPIFFTTPEGKKISLELKPGQAAIYLGCISEHWREKYKGNKYSQVFLHYVKSRGPNGKHYFDNLNRKN